jgi:hypothetical protein
LSRGLIDQVTGTSSGWVAERGFAFGFSPVGWILARVTISPVVSATRATPQDDGYK